MTWPVTVSIVLGAVFIPVFVIDHIRVLKRKKRTK